MMGFIFFLAILACLSSVLVTANIMTSKEEELTKVSDGGNYNDCLKEFLSSKTSFLAECQNQTLACVASGLTRNDIEMMSFKNLHSEDDVGKMKNVQESLRSCYLKKDLPDLINCLNSFDYESRKVLDEIKERTKILDSKFKEMDKEVSDCLNKQVEENSMKIGNTLSSCATNKKESSISPQVEEIKKMYETLKTCIEDDNSEEGYFDDCMKQATINKDLQNYWAQNAAKFSEELTELDQKEKICLRHFVASFVLPAYKFNYDLEKCLKEGFNESENIDRRGHEVFKNYGTVRSLLLSCRVNSNPSEIEMCISEVISQHSQAVLFSTHSMSDSYLKKLYEQILTKYNNEETCAGYIFENVQFKGLFMKDSAKASMAECLNRAYVSNASPPTADDVLQKLGVIKDSLTKCLLKSRSVFSKCVAQNIAVHSSSLDYIISSPLYESQYKQHIEEHDRNKKTCFSKILEDYKIKSYSSVGKCIKNKFFNVS